MVKPTRDIPKEPEQEPWGACVSGRVFVGALPEHVRKLSEDEGLPIQWLYTTPPQRTWVGLTDEDLANCDDTELKQALYWEQILKEKNNVSR